MNNLQMDTDSGESTLRENLKYLVRDFNYKHLS